MCIECSSMYDLRSTIPWLAAAKARVPTSSKLYEPRKLTHCMCADQVKPIDPLKLYTLLCLVTDINFSKRQGEVFANGWSNVE